MTKPYPSPYSISWIQQLSEIDRKSWDTLAKSLSTPFLEWDWLRLMEISGSATTKTGWLPHHLTVWSGGNLVGVAPMYVKGHSAGEFVFDHVWADVAGRMGIKYYPKLVGMSPFTPMTGYRFLIAAGENELELTALMVAEIDRLCRRYNISGSSFLFVDPQWHRDMLGHGFYAWRHQGYKNFDEYLTMFNSNQRRNIKRERKALEKQGVFVKTFTGQDIPRNFFSLMYSYYERTNEKFGPWGCKYLTNSFFEGLYHHYRHRLLFVAAFEKSDPSYP